MRLFTETPAATHPRTKETESMKLGMMVGFEESIKTFTTLAVTAEKRGINSVYTVDAGRSATVTAIYSAHTPDKYSL